MKRNIVSTGILLTFFAFISGAQNVGINTTGAAPDAGAGLDVNFNNKGVLIPRVNIVDLNTIAPVVGSATESMLVYNTNTTSGVGYHYWDGARWVRLVTNGEAWRITGNNNTTAANFLGTTNAQPLVFRTSNTERMRILANGNIGIRNPNPTTLLGMTNGGINIGAASMADFINSGTTGVSLSGYNANNTNTFNAFEGATDYNGVNNVSGVLGLHLYGGPLNSPGIGVRGQTNDFQGIGVFGSRVNNGGPNTGFGGLFIGDLGFTGGIVNASDGRLKSNVETLHNSIEIILKLNPVSYYFDTLNYPHMGFKSGLDYGFIAQELENILPNIVQDKMLPIDLNVHTDKSKVVESKNQIFKTVDYTRLIPILTSAIQEQQQVINSQEDKIEALERKVEEILSRLE